MSTVVTSSPAQNPRTKQPARPDSESPFSEVLQRVCEMASRAREAQARLAQADSEAKDLLLRSIADALVEHADEIAAANEMDM
ncbi:MAG: gamma-glutamyl-phosphate reductase, partial [Bifidobacterium sp.]